MEPVEAAALVHEHGIVIVGERHGTNEFPQFVLSLALAAASRGRILVALEMEDDAGDPMRSFVRSPGGADDRERLLATSSWQRQDGRASEAMFALVDGVRRAVQAGARLELDVFDAAPIGDPGSPRSHVEREVEMAERLLRVRSRGATLALTGNVHAELVPRAGAPEALVPSAALIAEHSSLLTLVGRHAGGHAWCTLPVDGRLVSAAHPVEGDDRGRRPFIDVEPPSRVRSGIAYVGAITPSPPAVPR